jgi:hypothetical protein
VDYSHQDNDGLPRPSHIPYKVLVEISIAEVYCEEVCVRFCASAVVLPPTTLNPAPLPLWPPSHAVRVALLLRLPPSPVCLASRSRRAPQVFACGMCAGVSCAPTPCGAPVYRCATCCSPGRLCGLPRTLTCR